MAKIKNRVHRTYTINHLTDRGIRGYARGKGITASRALDELYASIAIKDRQLKDYQEEISRLTNGSPAY